MQHLSGATAFVAPIAFLASIFGLNGNVARADTFAADGVFDSVAVFVGQGVNQNLRQLPVKIATASVDWDKTYYAELGFGKIRGTLGQSFESLQGTPFASLRHGYETVLTKHFGLQYNSEVGAAYMLKTPDLELGELRVNFAAGAGLSYALGNPTYEDGADNDPERRYRTQFLALFDLEWHLADSDKLSIITRGHHRSGVYGLIAPRHVGSNFLAIGVCRKF